MINTFCITNKGNEYLTQAAAGRTLVITKGAFGNGVLPSGVTPESRQALVSTLGPLTIKSKTVSGNTMTVNTELSNKVNGSILPAFRLTEIGLYGKLKTASGGDDPNYGETLIMYGYAPSGTADYVDAVLAEYMISWPIVVSRSANITIEYTDEAHVNVVELEALKKEVVAGYTAAADFFYSGPANDNGIEMARVEGKSEQESTEGYQLFNASILKSHSANGATITNNGDGSFTVSGSGTLSNEFVKMVKLSTEETRALFSKAGDYKLNLNGKRAYPYFYVHFGNAAGKIAEVTISGGSVNLTQAHIDSEGFFVQFGFWGGVEGTIVPSTIKPMLYLEGDGTWETFTGCKAGPNHDYPLDIVSWGEDTNIHSGTRQLFDSSRLSSKTVGGVTITNVGDGIFAITGTEALTSDFLSFYTLTNEETLKLLKPGKLTLKAETHTSPYCFATLLDSNDNIIHEANNRKSPSNSFNITEDLLSTVGLRMRVGFYGPKGDAPTGAVIKPMLYQEGDGTWEEYHHESVTINQPLRSLPNGVCDTYENGKITRRVGVVVFDGSEDENWNRDYTSDENKRRMVTSAISGLVKKTENNQIAGLYCTHYERARADDTYSLVERVSIDDLGRFHVYDETYNDVVGDWTAWLAEHPMTVLYELATPVIEEASLPTIQSFPDWTNVWHDSLETEIEWHVNHGGSGGGGSVVTQITGVTIPASGWMDETELTALFRYRINNEKIGANMSAEVDFRVTDYTEEMASSVVRATNHGVLAATTCNEGYVDIYCSGYCGTEFVGAPDTNLVCDIKLTEVKEV